MSPRYQLAAGLAGLLALASCSDDPAAPPGAAQPGALYDVTVEFYSRSITALCARNGNDVYAGGQILAHWDGESWRPLPYPRRSYWNDEISQIWFSANGDLYLATGEMVWRFNGTAWDRIRVGYPSGLWGAPDGTIFTAADHYVHRFDGSVWATDTLSTSWVIGVWGENSNNVYAAGYQGFISHFDGNTWTPMPTDSDSYLEGVWRFGDGPMYALDTGNRLHIVDGEVLTPLMPAGEFRIECIWPSPSGLWAAGADYEPAYHGIVYHYDGSSWNEVLNERERLYTGTTSPDGAVFIAGENGVWKRTNGTNAHVLGGLGERGETVNNLWTSPEGDVIAVGAEAFQYNSSGWTNLHKEQVTATFLSGVCGLSSRDFYVVGDRMILHYDGRVWDWVSSGFESQLYDVWVGRNELLAVGAAGRAVRMRSGTWDLMDTGTNDWLLAVSGWEGGAYAVGESGTILRYDGERWHPEVSPTKVNLNDVVAFDNERAVAVGDDRNAIFVRDTQSWKRMSIGLDSGAYYYEVVEARSPENMFIGGNGSLVHYNAGRWTLLSEPLTDETYGIAELPGGDLIVAGSGAILRYRRR